MTNGERFKGAKERAEAFHNFCAGSDCRKCELHSVCDDPLIVSAFHWLDLEASAEEPLPCPFCGGRVQVKEKPKDGFHTGLAWLMCGGCGYASSNEFDKASAIAAHNRVARAAKEKEAK